jgi:hypothetical protein
MIFRNGSSGVRPRVDSLDPRLSTVYGRTCRNTGIMMEQILYVALGFGPTLAAMHAAWKMANRN